MNTTEWNNERCPKCGAQLLTNGRNIWCSFIGPPACDYGIKERVKVTPTNTSADTPRTSQEPICGARG